MRNELLFNFFLMLVKRLPMLLLVFGATIAASVRWKLHPRASLMVLIASFIYLLEAPFFFFFLYGFDVMLRSLEVSTRASGWLYSGLYFFEDFALAAIIVLVVGAAFAGRSGSVRATD